MTNMTWEQSTHLLSVAVAVVTLLSTIAQATTSAGDVSLFEGLRSVTLTDTHKEILTTLRKAQLPSSVKQDTANPVDLSSYTPFCNANISTIPIESSLAVPQCVRWEEQEVDMLLMYIDLLAVGMKQTLAEQFYKQIRCLSRANIVPVPHHLAWQVCFTLDYSQHIGTLLSNYVNQDFKLNPPVEDTDSDESDDTASHSSRFMTHNFDSSSVTDRNRGSFLLMAFNQDQQFRIYRSSDTSQALYYERTQTSCCESCPDINYFVNIEKNQCLLNPFGKHCCHKACKSLGRLRVGASSSVSYCCLRCNPLPCTQSS